ncbi:MAG: FtsH protease activity modulator HflK [Deltaproteobacteria bacterium]|nr:FtsH protease activity modulator HflK [Deltaproteobacteria bacterium]
MTWDWEKLQQQREKHQGDGRQTPPQVDELLKKIKSFKLPGGPIIFVILFLIFLGFTTFFTVAVDEVGIIQRFGKYSRTCQPGLNIKMPAGIEKVTKVKIKRIYKSEFGFKTSGVIGASENTTASLMLTGDLNVALVPWIVQYRIKDPYNYLFKIEDQESLIRDMSEAAMSSVIGDRSINEVISKREEIAVEAKQILQTELNKAEAGIHIVTIEMKKTNVPSPVQPSFNEVNQAMQEKEKTIYQAKEEYNKAIPAAKGEAERVVKDAEGFALDRINRSQGDAERFRLLYEEYIKAKDVTKRRLYLETMKNIFPKLGDKYIIDEKNKNLLPLLNIGSKN